MDPISFVNFLTWTFWILLFGDFILLAVLLGSEILKFWKERHDD